MKSFLMWFVGSIGGKIDLDKPTLFTAHAYAKQFLTLVRFHPVATPSIGADSSSPSVLPPDRSQIEVYLLASHGGKHSLLTRLFSDAQHPYTPILTDAVVSSTSIPKSSSGMTCTRRCSRSLSGPLKI